MLHVKKSDMEAKVIVTTELQLRAIVADAVNAALKHYQSKSTDDQKVDPYGDFKWLSSTCPGVPASTLRIKSAAGEIPGVVKFGKRVLYDKAAVLHWLQSQTRPITNTSEIEEAAEEQILKRLDKR